MKSFIVTIDTEGDNLWGWKSGAKIDTRNSVYIPRFQYLCNEYGYKPVWLCNWEMMHDDRFAQFVIAEERKGKCEVGMHLHAWNNPPEYDLLLSDKSGAPYLIEYPFEIMEEKVSCITREFISIFGHSPISHRAGRWGINNEYFQLLNKYGYKVDCSITPGIDWRTSHGQTPGFKGPNYANEDRNISVRYGVLEVPLTTYESDFYSPVSLKRYNGLSKTKYRIKSLMKYKRILLLRPNGKNFEEMKWVVDENKKSDSNYLMFVLHSSELMPGGSPSFKSEESIEALYQDLKAIFEYVMDSYVGNTLSEFYSIFRGANE